MRTITVFIAALFCVALPSTMHGITIWEVYDMSAVTNPELVCAEDVRTYGIREINPHNGWSHPDDYASTMSTVYDWNVQAGSCYNGPCPTDKDEAKIKWNKDCRSDGEVSCMITIHYLDTNNNPQSWSSAVRPFDVNVHKIPSTLDITGDFLIECNNTSTYEYYATSCAMEYIWTVQGVGWSSNNSSTRKLVVTPDFETSAQLTVRARNIGCTTGVQEKTTTEGITRDCPDDKLYASATSNLPEHTAVNDWIRVDNSNQGITYVPLGDTVFFKAGDFIAIESTFGVDLGGEFQANVAPCNDCLAFKTGSGDPWTDTEELEEEAVFVVCPNPSNGHFRIKPKTEAASLERVEVSVYSLDGRLVRNEISSTGQLELDIQSEPRGTYLLRLKARDQVYHQQIVTY